MGSALEASSQRIRYHLRRPIPGRGEVLTRNARNTVKEIVPTRTRHKGSYHGSRPMSAYISGMIFKKYALFQSIVVGVPCQHRVRAVKKDYNL